MSDDPTNLFSDRLVVTVKDGQGEWISYDTGLRGMYAPGLGFTLPFQDEITAEEGARIVSQALRRRTEMLE